MHFITGGAFNGKGKWVYHFYGLAERKNWHWHSHYQNIVTQFERLGIGQADVVVINGVEMLIKKFIDTFGLEDARKEFRVFLQHALRWEQELAGNQLIIIGSDITKGVVPVSASDRAWRDLVGWCYQDITDQAKRVDIVWYGLAQKLKVES